jgi:predicted Zn-dependent protease
MGLKNSREFYQPQLITALSLGFMLRISILLLFILFFVSPSQAEEEVLPDLNPLPATIEQSGPDNYIHLQKKIARWNDSTKYIMVYIADGSHLSGWNPENVNAVKAAFSEWERVMYPRFRFIYMPDERGSDVKVVWTTQASASDGHDAAGLNEYQTWGKFICKNDIKLSLIHPGGTIYPPTQIYSTTLHEAGHMLGLKGHSDSPKDVMYFKGQNVGWNEIEHLSTRDINTLKMVYAAKADYVNPEGYHLSNFDTFKKTQKGHRLTIVWVPMPGIPFPVPIPLPF